MNRVDADSFGYPGKRQRLRKPGVEQLSGLLKPARRFRGGEFGLTPGGFGDNSQHDSFNRQRSHFVSLIELAVKPMSEMA